MPWGRLTHQDRQHIADGLTRGLAYAEIARQLGRPTSTISREVARNGGPDAYQANPADQATRQRAHRRNPTSPTLPRDVNTAGREPEAVLRFQEWTSAQMTQTGLPHMPARVLACLLATDTGSLTASDLVAWLQVSPASVSKAVSYLEKLDFVTRTREHGSRRQRYVIGDDVWYRSWSRIAQSYMTWANAARQGVEILGPATPAGARMHQMAQFFEILVRSNDQAIEQWRQITTAQQQG
jgi:DNA-binding transcriptional regulator GbsR (MarR family)